MQISSFERVAPTITASAGPNKRELPLGGRKRTEDGPLLRDGRLAGAPARRCGCVGPAWTRRAAARLAARARFRSCRFRHAEKQLSSNPKETTSVEERPRLSCHRPSSHKAARAGDVNATCSDRRLSGDGPASPLRLRGASAFAASGGGVRLFGYQLPVHVGIRRFERSGWRRHRQK